MQTFNRILFIASLINMNLACTSTPPAVVHLSPNGNEIVLQLARDGKSSMGSISPEDARNTAVALEKNTEISNLLFASIAELHMLGNQFDLASSSAREALKKDVKNIAAMKTLIKIYLFNNKPNEAILLANNALQIERDSDILCLKGYAYYILTNYIEARELWKKSLEINPFNHSAQMNLAVLYYHNRNLRLAGIGFEKVLAKDPNYSDALIGKALVLSAQGNYIAAKNILLALHKENSKSQLILYNLAVIEKERFANYTQALNYVDNFIQAPQLSRQSTEKGMLLKQELSSLIAKQKQEKKLSDSELIQLANKTSQAITRSSPVSAANDAQELPQAEVQTAPKEKSKPSNSAPAVSNKPKIQPTAAPVPSKDDANSLEEAIR